MSSHLHHEVHAVFQVIQVSGLEANVIQVMENGFLRRENLGCTWRSLGGGYANRRVFEKHKEAIHHVKSEADAWAPYRHSILWVLFNLKRIKNLQRRSVYGELAAIVIWNEDCGKFLKMWCLENASYPFYDNSRPVSSISPKRFFFVQMAATRTKSRVRTTRTTDSAAEKSWATDYIAWLLWHVFLFALRSSAKNLGWLMDDTSQWMIIERIGRIWISDPTLVEFYPQSSSSHGSCCQHCS